MKLTSTVCSVQPIILWGIEKKPMASGIPQWQWQRIIPIDIVAPSTNKRFIITSIIIYANKNVSANTDATVTIFEADGPTSTQGTNKTIFTQDIPQKVTVVIPNLNVIVSEAKWVNGVTNDDDVSFNISGYYVDA